MKWALFRDAPFRPLYANGLGFQRPKRDDSRPLWLCSSEQRASMLRKFLRHDSGGYVQIDKAPLITRRMKEDWE